VALPIVSTVGVMLVRRHPVAPAVTAVLLVKITILLAALWLGVLAQLLTDRHRPFTADMSAVL